MHEDVREVQVGVKDAGIVKAAIARPAGRRAPSPTASETRRKAFQQRRGAGTSAVTTAPR